MYMRVLFYVNKINSINSTVTIRKYSGLKHIEHKLLKKDLKM